MVFISWIIIKSLLGVAKLTLRSTHLDLKQKRVSHTLTHSNVSIARNLTLLTQSNVHSENTVSTKSSTSRNMLISRKLGVNQSALTWVTQENNFKRFKNLFTKHLQKQLFNQHYSQSQPRFWYLIHLRAIMDNSQIYPEFNEFQRYPFIRVSNHPNWLTFARELSSSNKSPRVIIYINIRLLSLCSSFRKDIINHRDIILTLFFNNNSTFWVMNVYLDSSYTASKYLKNTKMTLLNLLIIAGNFNIRNSFWDPAFPHHSYLYDDILIVADSLI